MRYSIFLNRAELYINFHELVCRRRSDREQTIVSFCSHTCSMFGKFLREFPLFERRLTVPGKSQTCSIIALLNVRRENNQNIANIGKYSRVCLQKNSMFFNLNLIFFTVDIGDRSPLLQEIWLQDWNYGLGSTNISKYKFCVWKMLKSVWKFLKSP